MKLGLMLQVGAGSLEEGRTPRWSDLREMARAAEAVGFDTLFVPDHLLFRRSPPDNTMLVEMPEGKTRGVWEAWTILAAMAEATERIQLGPFVACNGFRNPALLAKMAITLDEVSEGRLILGVGAGWHEPEYHAFGFPFDHRVGRFEEALQIIVPLLREGQVDFQGKYYQVRDCEIEPRGPRPGGPPILIGAQRPRMMRLAAEYADIYDTDFHLDPTAVAERFQAIKEACTKVGRDPGTLELATGTWVALTAAGTVAGDHGVATFELEDVSVQARIGTSEELIAYARSFEAVGADRLTLTLVDPPGPRGIELLAPMVEGLRRVV